MKKNCDILMLVPGAWQGAHCVSCHCGYEGVLIFPLRQGFSLNLCFFSGYMGVYEKDDQL